MTGGAYLIKSELVPKDRVLLIISSIPPICINQPSANDEYINDKDGIESNQVFLTDLKQACNVTNTKKRKLKIKRTNNRKKFTTNSKMTHNDKTYLINEGNVADKNKSGIYIEPMTKIINQFQICQRKWGGRVFGLRQELHMPHTTDTNKVMSLFISRLNKRLKREYGFKEIGYAWAREYHGSGKGQHYHYVLFLDGRKVRHPKKVSGIVRDAWAGIRSEFGYNMGYIQKGSYRVDDEEVAADFIYRISYLAKVRGKGHRLPQTKDYGCSRMKIDK